MSDGDRNGNLEQAAQKPSSVLYTFTGKRFLEGKSYVNSYMIYILTKLYLVKKSKNFYLRYPM